MTATRKPVATFREGSFTDLAVACDNKNHTVQLVGNEIVLLDHGVAHDVMLALGSKRTACHKLQDSIQSLASRMNCSLPEAFQWTGLGVSISGVRAWKSFFLTPSDVSRLRESGVVLPRDYRKLKECGLSNIDAITRWAAVMGGDVTNRLDTSAVATYLKNGVIDPQEASAWLGAGLRNPKELEMLLAKGVTPQKYLIKKQEISSMRYASQKKVLADQRR